MKGLDLATFKFLLEKTNGKISSEPDELSLVCYRGILFGKIGMYEKAVKDFSFLIIQSPDQPNFYFLRGYCYYFLKRFSEARQDFIKGLSLDSPGKFETDNLSLPDTFFNITNERDLKNMKRILEFEFNYNYVSLSEL